MVKIRLTRTGRIHLPAYKLCVINAREKRDSKAIEYVGHFSPMTKELVLNEDRIKHWLSIGAQPSNTVARMLIKKGLLDKTFLFDPRFKQKAGKQAEERAAKKAEKANAPKEEKVEEVVAVVEEAPAAEEAAA